jgi:hypothetical protein
MVCELEAGMLLEEEEDDVWAEVLREVDVLELRP